MKFLNIKIGIVKIFLFSPLLVFSQIREASFGVYFGLNEYFQNTPIIREYDFNENKSVVDMQNNFGINFQELKDDSFVSFDLNYSSVKYRDVSKMENFPVESPLNSYRMFFNIELVFGKRKKLTNRFELLYGVGTNLRLGYEDFLMQIIPFPLWIEVRYQRIFRLDPGLSINSKLLFNVSERFSLFTALNLSASPFLIDRKNWHRSREFFIYDNNSSIRPARFDLSLRLGLNFNLYR